MARIEVTQDDIDNGCIMNSHRCPIARAINRVLKEGFYSVIGMNHIQIRQFSNLKSRLEIAIRTSDTIRDFTHKFDHEQKVVPFSFELPILEGLLK